MIIAQKWILTTLAFIPFVIGQVSHATPYYKWVDEQGATHYTQTAKQVDINTQIPSDSATAIKNLNTQTKNDLKADDAAEKLADKAKADSAAEAARKNKNAPQCQQLRASLALLQTGRRVHENDANGERSYLTEDQKATQIQQTTDQIQKNCP